MNRPGPAQRSPVFLSNFDRVACWLLAIAVPFAGLWFAVTAVINGFVPWIELLATSALLVPLGIYWRARAGRSISFANEVIRLHDGKRVLELISLDELAEVGLGGPLSEARFVASDGRQIVVPTNERRWIGVADEIAKALPSKTILRPETGHGSQSLTWSGALLMTGALALSLAVAALTTNLWIGLGCFVLALPIFIHGWMLVAAVKVMQSAAAASGKRHQLTTADVDAMIRVRRWAPSRLQDGRACVYPPLARQHRESALWVGTIAKGLLALLSVAAVWPTCGLGLYVATFAVPAWWKSVRLLRRTRLLPDRVWFQGGSVRWEKKGVLHEATSDRGSGLNRVLWLGRNVMCSKSGQKAWIERELLMPEDSPRYTPENPWEDLWRGRAPILPRWLE